MEVNQEVVLKRPGMVNEESCREHSFTCPFLFLLHRVTFGLWESQPLRWQREPPVSTVCEREGRAQKVAVGRRGAREVVVRRALRLPAGKGPDGVSSMSQLCATCTPCEPSSLSLGTRHLGSSPRNGRCFGFGVEEGLWTRPPVLTLCVQAWICLIIEEVLGGGGAALGALVRM